jgi:hypothetical protein
MHVHAQRLPQWASGLQSVIDTIGMLASRHGNAQDALKLQQLQHQVWCASNNSTRLLI